MFVNRLLSVSRTKFQSQHGVDVAKYPNFRRWRDAVAARPAVVKGMAVP